MSNSRDFLNSSMEETEVIASNHHLVGRNRLPAAEIFSPSTNFQFRGLRQVYKQSGGEGAIKFNDAIAAESQALTEKFQKVSNGLEVNKLLTSVETNMINAQEELIRQEPENYTEKISSTFDNFAQEALKNASNSDVYNVLETHFVQSKYNHVRKAFADENAIIVAKAQRGVEESIQQLNLNTMLTPENFETYSQQINTILSPMKEILPESVYKRYAKEKYSNFIYCYGEGIINKDPYTAQQMLGRDLFRSNLEPENYMRLQKYAQNEITSREKQAQEQLDIEERIKKEKRADAYADASFDIALGKLTQADIDKLDLTHIQKISLKKELISKEYKNTEGRAITEKILKHIDEKTPQDDIPPAYQNKHFNERMILRKQNNKDFTLVEAVNDAISCQYTSNLHYLNNEIKQSIYSKDPNKIINAISAVKRVRNASKDYLIEKLPNEYRNYLDSIEDHLTSDPKINKRLIEEYYEKYFSPKPITFDTQEGMLNAISPVKKREIYKNFIKELDTSSWYEWGYDTTYFKENQEFEGYFWKTVKDNYIFGRCPDVNEAIRVTKKQIGADFKISKINGKEKILYRPFDRAKIINQDINKANKFIHYVLKDIEKQFQKYGDKTFEFPIKTTGSNRIISVNIDGEDSEKFVNIEYYKKGKYRMYYEHDGERIYLKNPENETYVEIEVN